MKMVKDDAPLSVKRVTRYEDASGVLHDTEQEARAANARDAIEKLFENEAAYGQLSSLAAARVVEDNADMFRTWLESIREAE